MARLKAREVTYSPFANAMVVTLPGGIVVRLRLWEGEREVYVDLSPDDATFLGNRLVSMAKIAH